LNVSLWSSPIHTFIFFLSTINFLSVHYFLSVHTSPEPRCSTSPDRKKTTYITRRFGRFRQFKFESAAAFRGAARSRDSPLYQWARPQLASSLLGRPHCTVRPWSQPVVKTHARTVVTGTLQLQHHHDLPEQPDGIRLHVVHADQPSDRFEKWCSRKNKVRSLPRPATQHYRHASADSSQGSLLPHSSAYRDFQWMFPHWNSSCSFGRHSRGFFSEDPAQRQVQPPFATVHTLSACMP
jgi:hypothetical protein